MNEVIGVAKASDAHNFICQLPRGYDTQVCFASPIHSFSIISSSSFEDGAENILAY